MKKISLYRTREYNRRRATPVSGKIREKRGAKFFPRLKSRSRGDTV